MSDGCVATQAGEAPRIAWLRLKPLDRVAALARLPLVAARAVAVVEVGAAGALEQVAADRRHVADLRRRAGDDRARQHRVSRAYRGVLGHRGVARGRADEQAAAVGLVDRRTTGR